MTRPSIVRADTIDLQDHDAPSAKDHRSHRGPGAHQTETLREVDREAHLEQQHSPRLSWTDPNDDPAVQQQRKETEDLVTGVQARMAQEDALAVAQNGGVSSSDEGEGDGDELDDDLMDRISSSPSIEDEDIDFEFVYALHTFVATVEGQANATKGDTMVLLDDSNSYWWLVRVVKDSSIGYLPAEHIETPTERLARLNKHRNVDLSATMLGDQNPKAKNSFKSIRKRWKSVTFAEPTYVDYQTHEGDYSSDDEDMEELFGQDVASEKTETKEDVTQQEDEVTDETAKVAPLQTRKDSKEDIRPAEKVEEEERRSSEEILDGRSEPRKMSNGTVRDSFFKDDKAETKKITLTPNLLRDPDTASRPSTDSVGSKDLKTRASLDKMDKELMSDKESKKKPQPAATTPPQKSKDKKPSAIRSFFSRKDKKRTSEDDDGESFGKRSMDIMESRDSEEPEDMANSPDKAPTRSPSKLQKQQPRTEPSPTRKNSNAASKKMPQTDLSAHFTEQRTNDVSNVPPASMKIVDPETQETKEVPSNQQQQRPTPKEEKGGLAKSLLPRSRSDSTSTKPQKTVKAKSRMELDASDSSEEEEALLETPSPAQAEQEKEKEEKALRPQLPGAFPDSYMTTASDSTITQASQQQHPQSQQQRPRERLSESPVEVSPVSPNATPGLVADEPSSEEGSPSPELKAEQGWDDAKLRAFFDDGEHAKDLLAVVFDTTDVEPVGGDHPIISGFREQNAKLAEITTQLDNMLGDWLARKQRSRGTL